MAKNFQLALRPNMKITNRKRNIQQVYIPKVMSNTAAMYLQQRGMQAAQNAMKRGYRAITKYRKRDSERSLKKRVKGKKRSRKMKARKSVMKLTGYRIYKGVVHGLLKPGLALPQTLYGSGLTHSLYTAFLASSDPTSIAFNYSADFVFPNTMTQCTTFTWCPYHPGGKFGYWNNNMLLTDGQNPNITIETGFANYASLHAGTTTAANNNYINTTGPCNDNIAVKEPYSVAKVGVTTSAMYYSILGYYNNVTVYNSGSNPCVLHVLQIKFKSKCMYDEADNKTNTFDDNWFYFKNMTDASTAQRNILFKETTSKDMANGKLNKKLVRVVSHKTMILGQEGQQTNRKLQFPARRSFKISGTCNIKRSRTCESSSALNDSFDAKEQLNEAYQRDTYYMMYATPYNYDVDTATPVSEVIDVQFKVDKTVIYNLPASNLN